MNIFIRPCLLLTSRVWFQTVGLPPAMSAPPAVALSDIVNRTLTLLRATVPREVANEALLSKPPFRFLHDVVMEVMLTTGFGMGLWDGAEMDAIGLRSAEGREGKGRFLSKWVALVCVARGLTQSPPPFRVPNTLAGQEPEMTNILLQYYCEAATSPTVDKEACVTAALSCWPSLAGGGPIPFVPPLLPPSLPPPPPSLPSSSSPPPSRPLSSHEKRVAALLSRPKTPATVDIDTSTGSIHIHNQGLLSFLLSLPVLPPVPPSSTSHRQQHADILTLDDSGEPVESSAAPYTDVDGSVEEGRPITPTARPLTASNRPRTAAAWDASLATSQRSLQSLNGLLGDSSATTLRPMTSGGLPPRPGTSLEDTLSTTAADDVLLGILSGSRVSEAKSALLVAAEAGDVLTVERILGYRAPKTIGSSRMRPLFRPDDARGLSNFSPLHLASSRGHLSVVKLLLKAGCAVNATSESGDTSVHIAAYGGNLPVLEALMDHCANINEQNEYGETPLIQASRKGHPAVVRFLLLRGADPSITDRVGDTAVEQAPDAVTKAAFTLRGPLRAVGRYSGISEMPWGVITRVFGYLSIKDLGSAAITTSRWRRIVDEDGRELFAKFGGRSRWENALSSAMGFGVAPLLRVRPPSVRSSLRKGSSGSLREEGGGGGGWAESSESVVTVRSTPGSASSAGSSGGIRRTGSGASVFG